VGETIALTGVGLESVVTVVFGGGISADFAFDDASGVLTVSVPEGATTGQLSVSNGTSSAKSDSAFTVTQ
jgi:hypothetical protein